MSSLTPEQFRRVRELFDQLEERSDLSAEELCQALADEPVPVRDEVLTLLGTSPTQVAGLEDFVGGALGAAAGPSADEQAPALPEISGYRLLSVLGEGGMGVVYAAEQLAPRRPVAIKCIRPGLDSASVLSRFRAEQQALAVMDHAGIARVYDAGTDSRGLPYFVMEHIEGEAITTFCRRQRLGLNERLLLFGSVCDAVQHAHQKGIIHRDLKPSNILVVEQPDEVSEDSGAGPAGAHQVKVIDFGIARALEEGEASIDATRRTRLGDLMGTPEYMSPEQAEGRVDLLDTRSDVYSLGVVLYELLTEGHPLRTSNSTEPTSLDELRRRIRRDPTPRPSTGLLQTGRSGQDDRRTSRELSERSRALRGDLDVLTLKAMAKEPDQRYASAAELASDVRRYLASQPILARPPSWSYVAWRFTQRNRGPVLAAAALLLALIAGLIGTTVNLRRARAAEASALDNLATAERTAEFLESLFDAADPENNLGREISVKEVVDEGIGRLDELDDEPVVQARMARTLGRVQLNLGDYDRAEQLLSRAAELAKQEEGRFPELHAMVSSGHFQWAAALRGRGELDRALGIARAGLEGLRQEEEASKVAGLLWDLVAQIERSRGELVAAREASDRALRILGTVEDDPQAYAAALNTASLIALEKRDFSTARTRLEESIATFAEELPPEHPFFARLNNNLSAICRKLGELRCARDAADLAVRVDRAAKGDRHPDLVMDLINLAQVQQLQGDWQATFASLDEGLSIAAEVLPAGHRTYLVALNEKIRTHALRAGRGDFEHALELSRERLGFEERLARDRWVVLAQVIVATRRLGDLDAARQAWQRAQSWLEGELPESERGWRVSSLWLHRAVLEAQLGDPDVAREAFDRGQELARCEPDARCGLDDLNQMVSRAQYWAMVGEPELALRALELSLEFPMPVAWAADLPEWQVLHSDPRWPPLAARLRAMADG